MKKDPRLRVLYFSGKNLPASIGHNTFFLATGERIREFVFLLAQPGAELVRKRGPKGATELLRFEKVPTTIIEATAISAVELLQFLHSDTQGMSSRNVAIMFAPKLTGFIVATFCFFECFIFRHQFRASVNICLPRTSTSIDFLFFLVDGVKHDSIGPLFPNIGHNLDRFVTTFHNQSCIGSSGVVVFGGANCHSCTSLVVWWISFSIIKYSLN